MLLLLVTVHSAAPLCARFSEVLSSGSSCEAGGALSGVDGTFGGDVENTELCDSDGGAGGVTCASRTAAATGVRKCCCPFTMQQTLCAAAPRALGRSGGWRSGRLCLVTWGRSRGRDRLVSRHRG